MSEKSFQQYFLKLCPHAYRISADVSPGTPDIEIVNGLKTYRVELKILKIGSSGNKKIKPIFKPTQPPWYFKFLSKGGKGLYVAFKLNSGYGLLEVTKGFILSLNSLKYLDLKRLEEYKEFKTLKELINEFYR